MREKRGEETLKTNYMNEIKIELTVTNHKGETVNNLTDKLTKWINSNEWGANGVIKEGDDESIVFACSSKLYSAGPIYVNGKNGLEPIPNSEKRAKAHTKRLNKQRGYF